MISQETMNCFVFPSKLLKLIQLEQLDQKYDLATEEGCILFWAQWLYSLQEYYQTHYGAIDCYLDGAAINKFFEEVTEQNYKKFGFSRDYIGLPKLLGAIYLLREDLQSLYPLNQEKGRDKILGWFLTNGCVHEQLRYGLWQLFSRLEEPLEQDGIGVEDAISRAMYVIWLSRFDLWQSMPCKTHAGRRTFLGWFLLHGSKQISGFYFPNWILQKLQSPVAFEVQGVTLSIPLFLEAIWFFRQDLHDYSPLSSAQGLKRFIGHYLLSSPAEKTVIPLPSWFVEHLSQPSPFISHAHQSGISLVMECLWEFLGLYQTIDLSHPDGYRKLLDWYLRTGRELLPDFFLSKWMILAIQKLFSTPSQVVSEEQLSLKSELSQYSLAGVQLHGWVKGELGIGEDVRSASVAMDEVSIQHIILNTARDTNFRQYDNSRNSKLSECPKYFTSITFLPAADHYRLYLGSDQHQWHTRYQIGSWPWELAAWPEHLNFVFEIVDEVWAPTTFIQRAYAAVTSKPVIHMPLVVQPITIKGDLRPILSISQEKYVFLFIYDTNSSEKRKNPDAVIKAFQLAFSRSDRDVVLVLKTMNTQNSQEHWRWICEQAAIDDRIVLINETFDRPQVLKLINTCNAFVSLHRSEGFGRNIAEAMLLEKPVIVSNYSGNTDFTHPDNSFLVNGETRSVNVNDYAYFKGQKWFEPDVYHAAELMKKCYLERQEADRKAKAGRQFIESNFNALKVGKLYLSFLQERGLVLKQH